MNRGMFSLIAGALSRFTISHGLVLVSNDIQVDVPSLANHLSGLELSTAGSSATFAVATGAATDSTNADFMKLTSALSKTTSAWSAGTGGGALDTSSIATSTWYHVWLIKRPDTGAVDVLVSLSASAPTMPTYYTLKRRIGAMKTDGSSQWTAFTQVGDNFIWSAAVQESSGIATTASRVSKTLSGVPTGIVVAALFRASVNAASGVGMLFTALGIESDQTPTTLTLCDLGTNTSPGAGAFEKLTNTSAQIGVRSSGTAGTHSLSTTGWKDTRGK